MPYLLQMFQFDNLQGTYYFPSRWQCGFSLMSYWVSNVALTWCRCLILRTNGELSLLDLDDGHEQVLTNSVELFWVTCGQSEEKQNLIEEVSWLDYGHRGMQVCRYIFIYLFFVNFQSFPLVDVMELMSSITCASWQTSSVVISNVVSILKRIIAGLVPISWSWSF